MVLAQCIAAIIYDLKDDRMRVSIINEVIKQLEVMPQHLQQQVLEFTQALATSEVRGTPGQQLLCFAGSIPPEDLQLMREAIEQDCERIDIDGW
ncbi:hypothetical protein L3556_15910 [Candidatus Synechococcus calcipolaris G9]|uniref:Uncharacterized protein n=1 Tax=Candidatus Synechococcus calcipolaris G9 TaxID=1497997 RepID=A0ABT6F3J5_9SYNE|nr:hypothetical protein [Candidatus Synechococcus calcipolaris]MDG2992404.1 hypothetical protein [Candidatus Synechococcus calcipolaris G9]